ncbi:hypothetical protein TOPH_05783 [Tolypocladium ophioglossoides CBS 100239]|uniref:Uncharacterized protein n=1 Tax=Tolypocladium ophioglossoides (strain CBS 100239) TaxID=1163406 RepID=A0A0L0N5Z3_TOLOC|nr:hypothetical protein TOPH_05783 [Tolypocladium ophioglossoides CBS 100239]
MLQHEKLVQVLLDHGAEVNAQGGEYDYALEVAKQVEGSIIAGVIYQAADPIATGKLNLNLSLGEHRSQSYPGGGELVPLVVPGIENRPHWPLSGRSSSPDGLCGGTGGLFNSDTALSPDLVKKNGKSPPLLFCIS